MFFDDKELSRFDRVQLKALPATPETGWHPPKDYPNFQYAKAIGFDFEVKEDDFKRGPGWSRGKSKIVGGSTSLLFPDNSVYTEYRPIRHTVESEYNLDVSQTVAYWKALLSTGIPKFGAHLVYDIGTAADEGIEVKGELNDCQYAEAIIDEEAFVNLDALGDKYLDRGKESNGLYEWCANAYGGKPTDSQRDNIWRVSPRLAGPYGERDSEMPLPILQKQRNELWAQGLWGIYRLECDLIPLYVKMRQQGVRVDVQKAELIYSRLTPLINNLYQKLFEISGVVCESTTGDDLKKVFRTLKIDTPLTELGNMSIAKEFLSQLDHPVADIVLQIRAMEIVKNTFLKNYIINGNINGVIHGEFHPLKSEEGGTVTGRYSSSNPNLQNIPVRTKLGKEIRSCFLPFNGHSCWEKGDYSQIQYRGLAHYAVGPGSDELRMEYNRNPQTDYHDRTTGMVKQIVGLEIPRRPIKNLNFANVMGAGKKKVKHMLRLDGEVTDQQSDTFYEAYHKGNPYVKSTLEYISKIGATIGYITSRIGRRMRFNLWEPQLTDWDDRKPGLPYQQAIRIYGQIKRAATHRAMAGMLQMFEADTMKCCLWKCFKDGVFDITGVPTLQVHDELGFSVISETVQQNEAYEYMHWIMENTLTANVPIRYEANRGPDWGSIE